MKTIAAALFGLFAFMGAAHAQVYYGARLDNSGAPTAGGSGYSGITTITLNPSASSRPGTCTTAPVLNVTLSGGAISSYSVNNPGECLIVPSNPVHAASGGATFILKWGDVAAALPGLSGDASLTDGTISITNLSHVTNGSLGPSGLALPTGDILVGSGGVGSDLALGTGVQSALGGAVDTTGGLGTIGTSGAHVGLLNGNNTMSGLLTASGGITGLPAPVNSSDAATKSYVDTAAPDLSAGAGLSLSGTVFSLASPVAINLGGTNETSQTAGGVTYFDGTHLTTGSALTFNGTGAFGLSYAGTGGTVQASVTNSGTASNGSTVAELFTALSGCTNCYSVMNTLGGSTPTMQVNAGAGLTGGMQLNTGAGSIELQPAGTTALVATSTDIFLEHPTFWGVAGSYTTPNAYNGGTGSSNLVNIVSTNSAIATVVSQVIGSTNSTSAYQAAILGSAIKNQSGNSYHAEGGLFTCDDNAGWSGSVGGSNNNFCEGERSMAYLNGSLGSVYGAVHVAYETYEGPEPLYMVGTESEVDNTNMAATNTFNQNQFTASYVATNGNTVTGVQEADAAFIVNPYNETAFHRGFFVPRGATAGHAVSYAQFEGDDESTFGLNLEQAIVSHALGIPNNSDIEFVNGTNNGVLNGIYANTDNTLRIADDNNWAAVELGTSSVLTLINGPLEMPGIPYHGSDAGGYALCLNPSGNSMYIGGTGASGC